MEENSNSNNKIGINHERKPTGHISDSETGSESDSIDRNIDNGRTELHWAVFHASYEYYFLNLERIRDEFHKKYHVFRPSQIPN